MDVRGRTSSSFTYTLTKPILGSAENRTCASNRIHSSVRRRPRSNSRPVKLQVVAEMVPVREVRTSLRRVLDPTSRTAKSSGTEQLEPVWCHWVKTFQVPESSEVGKPAAK